jgi:hemerythrin-like metal-binding protein
MDIQELNPELLIGIDPIDKDHRRIFSSVYAIHLAILDRNDNETLSRSFHELVVDLDEWFETEEALWEDVDYPEAAEHSARHQELSVELLKMDWDFMNGKVTVTDSALQSVMRMLAEHIVRCDKPFAGYYAARDNGV